MPCFIVIIWTMIGMRPANAPCIALRSNHTAKASWCAERGVMSADTVICGVAEILG